MVIISFTGSRSNVTESSEINGSENALVKTAFVAPLRFQPNEGFQRDDNLDYIRKFGDLAKDYMELKRLMAPRVLVTPIPEVDENILIAALKKMNEKNFVFKKPELLSVKRDSLKKKVVKSMKGENFNGKENKKKVFSKRIMMARVDEDLMKNIDHTFFEQSVESINNVISNMNHATRFWLAVKFSKNVPKNYTKVSITELFEICRGSVTKFLADGNTKNCDYTDYDGLTPLESNLSSVKRKHKFFESSAINYNELVKEGYFD